MKSQRYLNFILTIIALALVLNFLHGTGIIPHAYAGNMTVQEVDVNLKEIGGYSIYGGRLKVEISDEVRMNCTNCN